MRRFEIAVIVAAAMVVTGQTHTADVPVTPAKLVVMDKLARAGKATAVYVAKDAVVTKGPSAQLARR